MYSDYMAKEIYDYYLKFFATRIQQKLSAKDYRKWLQSIRVFSVFKRDAESRRSHYESLRTRPWLSTSEKAGK